MTTTVYHLCATREPWDRARATGEYHTDSLRTEGFIHTSTAEQIAGSANRYYATLESIVLLTIDLGRVRPPVVWEHSPHSPTPFPHIYGPLNIDAVTDCRPWTRDPDGMFRWIVGNPDAHG